MRTDFQPKLVQRVFLLHTVVYRVINLRTNALATLELSSHWTLLLLPAVVNRP